VTRRRLADLVFAAPFWAAMASASPRPEVGPRFKLAALSLRRFGEFVRLAEGTVSFVDVSAGRGVTPIGHG